MKCKFFFLFATLLVASMVMPMKAQTSFEEYKQQKDAKFQDYKDQKQKDFDAYRREKNVRYAEFLRQKWGQYDATPIDTAKQEEPIVPPVIYEGPEPTPIPQPIPEPKPIKIDKDILVIPTPQPQPKPIVPIVPQDDQKINKESISFYGTLVTIGFPNPDNFRLTRIDDQGIATAWEYLMEEKYDVVIATALSARKSLSLCDWAYMEMLQKVCDKHYGKMTNEADMMMAYVLIQSGYKVRFAYSDSQRMYVLVHSDYEIYDRTYFTIEDERYYPLNCNEHSLYISKASFEAEKPMSLQITHEQKFNYDATKIRKLESKKGVSAEICVNRNDIDFYNNYPTACINDDFGTRWAAYANTPLEKKIRDSLYPQLKKSLMELNELEQVNLLLNFVQTAFVYEYDDVVWGEDRAFFPSETLYYPYCDCEDRSIFFSRIVRDVLSLDVVLLYYPGHLATAVKFNSDVKGDYLMVKGEKYIVCDPTYIGAPVGETMPDMDNKKAKVIVLN